MKIALIGYGKMGKAIEAVSEEYNRAHENAAEIIFRFDVGNAQELTSENLSQADVAIDFSTPTTVVNHILLCADAGVPVVVGTTGWYDRFEEVKKYIADKDSGLLYAPNFSIGVNIFFAVNQLLAELMDQQKEYDVSIAEIHHTQKLDAPSGTAIQLAKQILEKVKRKKTWTMEKNPPEDEIQITAHRIENVTGTHTVTWHSEIDDIEIIHTAHSRKGFAMGAFLAARWMTGKKGIYTMQDVLGI